MSTKPIILVFVRYYLPGYKFGGPIRSIANTVEALGDQFDFRIITTDRDHGDVNPYANVKINQWQKVGKAQVYYLSADKLNFRSIVKVIKSQPHQIIYLNSFFDFVFSIKVLIAAKLKIIDSQNIVLAPRGEFGEAAIVLKSMKKKIYLLLAKLLGLYKKINWHLADEVEFSFLKKYFHVSSNKVNIARDMPNKQKTIVNRVKRHDQPEMLQIVFLSRVSEIKNLDFALNVLSEVKIPILFSIYGPINEGVYWERCQKIIFSMPENVKVEIKGSVCPDDVHNIMLNYDLFFLPTKSESHGHAIVESLMAGTPVLISDKTPWVNLERMGLGWDFPLEDKAKFIQVINEYSNVPVNKREERRQSICNKISAELGYEELLKSTRNLFLSRLLG